MGMGNKNVYKNLDPRGLSAPGLYIHVYDHYFQTSSPRKPLGQSEPTKILYGAEQKCHSPNNFAVICIVYNRLKFKLKHTVRRNSGI